MITVVVHGDPGIIGAVPALRNTIIDHIEEEWLCTYPTALDVIPPPVPFRDLVPSVVARQDRLRPDFQDI